MGTRPRQNELALRIVTGGLLGPRFVEPGAKVLPPLVMNARDGSPMVLVPAGEFEMGDGQDSDCPKHTVHLDAYCIGIYCVTNRQYKAFVEATRHKFEPHSHFGQAAYAEHPVVNVNWDDAVAYAKWAGCSLPTEAQWEKAARGPLGLIYPWGTEWDAGRCRNSGNKGPSTTCPVYEYAAGVSGYGTLNQSGNVWEWCSDWYESDYYGKSPRENPAGPSEGSYRVYRGGGWLCDGASIFRGARRYWNVPAFRGGRRGFRLVRAVR